MHIPISLNELNIPPFLQCIQTRLEPQTSAIPFGNFEFRFDVSDESIKLLLTEIGERISGLYLLSQQDYYHQLDESDDDNENSVNWKEEALVKQKLTLILPYTQNIEHLLIVTGWGVHLGSADILKLPATFPRLRSIGVEWGESLAPLLPDTVPLLSYFITRTPMLYHVMIPSCYIGANDHIDDSLHSVQAIRQHHHHHLPILELTGMLPINMHGIRELRGFRFKNFFARLWVDCNKDAITAPEEAYNIMSCVEWLAAQSETVTMLMVDIGKTRHHFTFEIPPLAAVKELELYCSNTIRDNECRIQPLKSNQFPLLRRLTLIRYRDCFGILQRCSLPTVRELHIESQLTSLTASWPKILPNLSILHFMVSFYSDHCEEDGNNLAFLLRHFPHITVLKLVLGKRTNQDFWDVLTGGAPRPLSSHDLLYGNFGGKILEKEETVVGGIYQTASLQNLRCKL